MLRFLASWKMIAIGLLLGAVAGGLLPSDPGEQPVLNAICLALGFVACTLCAASLAALLTVYRSDPATRGPRVQSRVLDDPVFGRIAYRDGFWRRFDGETPHEPPVMIDALESGPSQAQRDFYRKLMAQLDQFESRARSFIAEQLKTLHGERVDLDTFRVYAIETGPDADCQAGRCLIEFVDADESVVYRVAFQGGVPVSWSLDD